jgi:tetratricopeptide (TPR) repeat protein
VRLIYLFQIESSPVFYNLPGDPRTYDAWAQRIVAGDWLGERVFYQAPLYPYFLALLQAALGHDLWAIRVAQIALNAAACSLLYLAGSSWFSQKAGLAAALILSLYAPAIFFAGLIDKTAVDLFLIALLLAVLGAPEKGSRGIKWPAAGAILGLLGLSRENALVWAFLPPLWIWFQAPPGPRRARSERVGLFLLGLFLVLLPVGLRNLKAGGHFTLTTSQLGANFFIGNNPAADGTYGSIRAATGERQFEEQEASNLAAEAAGRALSPGEVSSYWLGRSWDYIRSQPIDWLRLMVKKWLMVWNVREIEDSDDFYLYRQWSWLLAFLAWFSHFGLLAPLAAVGWLLTWRERRKLWLLYAMIGAFALSVALFYIFGRYRFPLVSLLALFAGAGLVKAFELWKERGWRALGGSAGAALLTAVFVFLPVAGRPGPSATGYTFLANALAKQERIDEAIDNAQRALEIDPAYGVAHYNLANFYVAKGRFDDAASHYRRAIELYPRYVEAHGNLANVLVMRGEFGAAVERYREALKVSPAQGGIHLSLANVLTMQGRLDEAAEHYREALKTEPDSAQAHLNLGKVLAAKGDLGQATGHFRQAVRLTPDSAVAHESLARALVQQGQKEEAVQHYQEALRLMRSR